LSVAANDAEGDRLACGFVIFARGNGDQYSEKIASAQWNAPQAFTVGHAQRYLRNFPEFRARPRNDAIAATLVLQLIREFAMNRPLMIAFALFMSCGTIPALAQSGGGGSGGSSSGGGASAGGSAATGAASGPTKGATSPAGSPNAGAAGAGTAGVSGVPNGPANVGGLNNSGNDPSGAGNAAKAPDVPANNTVGTANGSGSNSTTRTPPSTGNEGPNRGATSGLANSSNVPAGDGGLRQNGTQMSGNGQATKTTEQSSDAQIDAENRKLEGKVKSICKGC
jgi:hypothetical protein